MKITSLVFTCFFAIAAQAQVKTAEQKEQQKILTPTDMKSIGPKQDDPRKNIGHSKKSRLQTDSTKAIGPKQDDPKKFNPNDPQAIGPKQDDPKAIKKMIRRLLVLSRTIRGLRVLNKPTRLK